MDFFDLLSCYSHIVLYVTNFPVGIMLTILNVSLKEKMVYDSLCFDLLPQQMSRSKKKYIDLCQHANMYKQVMLETLS